MAYALYSEGFHVKECVKDHNKTIHEPAINNSNFWDEVIFGYH